MTSEFPVSQIVKIGTRRCSYQVTAVDALEGGGWGLTLMPTETPFLSIWEGVYRESDGTWRTEQREIVTVEGSPIVPGMTACKGCGAPIRWVSTEAGRMTPVNPDGSTHWSCPAAAQFKKPKAAPAPETPAPADGDGQLDLL